MKENRRKVFSRFALELATLSKCTDRGVAAVITDKGLTQVYSIGINGGPTGGLDCLCSLGGKYTCIHAEANALAKCRSADQEKVMFCTLSPCVTCAGLIINNGFSAVVVIDGYKDNTGIKMLQDAGIKVFYERRDDL